MVDDDNNDTNTQTTTHEKAVIEKEVVWRDDLIRWEGGLHGDITTKKKTTTKTKKKSTSSVQEDDDDDDNSSSSSSSDGQSYLIDPFADPDPFEMFNLDFVVPNNNNNIYHHHDEGQVVDNTNNNILRTTTTKISLQIKGYKTNAEQIWQSTGLTLWRASHYLCEYQIIQHSSHSNKLFTGTKTRILELGAGLGLNGILAWRLMLLLGNNNIETFGGQEVCITDGDIDALVHLRENVERNRPRSNSNSSNDNHNNSNNNEEATSNNNCKVTCHQLIWGKESSQKFLSQIAKNRKYNVILASDIIYSAVIVEPLWETVQTLLLEKENDDDNEEGGGGGVFVMAFARRKVPVSIDMVLEKAVELGFRYDLVKEDLEDGIWVYEFRFR
ncbi:hypothetical protein ACHAXM_004264 [Skeletonema potamos]